MTADLPLTDESDDPATLQRQKTMLEIRKLDLEIIALQKSLKHETFRVVVAAITGGAAFLAAAFAFAKLFLKP